jgi:hypothetical protein
MGLVPSFARILLIAKGRGVRFDRILTIGRQHWLVPLAEQIALEKDFGLSSGDDGELVCGGFSDYFFRKWLGADQVVALDASAYEGATRIHDLNQPVPDEWNESFDVVLDAGTLEHVFNFPTALESCLRMVKLDGTLFWGMPANNNCGHGFYQFSPELVFRALSSESGFRIGQVLLFTHPFPGAELSSRMKFYALRDPDEVRARVAFMNGEPAGLLVEARRERRVTLLFKPAPQQSDYARAWEGASPDRRIFFSANNRNWAALANRAAFWLERTLPRRLRNWMAGQYQKRYLFSLRNKGLFRRLRNLQKQ